MFDFVSEENRIRYSVHFGSAKSQRGRELWFRSAIALAVMSGGKGTDASRDVVGMNWRAIVSDQISKRVQDSISFSWQKSLRTGSLSKNSIKGDISIFPSQHCFGTIDQLSYERDRYGIRHV